jgi:hypothetical protein
MILLDWAILISLIITIIYCWKLNNRITEFKKGNKEMQELVKNLDRLVEKAVVTTKNLNESNNKFSSEASKTLAEFHTVENDLSFMIARAKESIDKFEKYISLSRKIEFPSLDKTVAESAIEKQYSKKLETTELKKSTIESLLARIANVKENNKMNQQENLFKKKTYPEEA